MIPAYDLKEFTLVEGDQTEKIWARPTAWDGIDETGEGIDVHGNEITPIEYQATSPVGGGLMILTEGETFTVYAGQAYCYCSETGFGKDHVEELLQELQDIQEVHQFHFINPIEMGMMESESKWLVTS